jgi:hypothetical protein
LETIKLQLNKNEIQALGNLIGQLVKLTPNQLAWYEVMSLHELANRLFYKWRALQWKSGNKSYQISIKINEAVSLEQLLQRNWIIFTEQPYNSALGSSIIFQLDPQITTLKHRAEILFTKINSHT